jgi:hypothetical protein
MSSCCASCPGQPADRVPAELRAADGRRPCGPAAQLRRLPGTPDRHTRRQTVGSTATRLAHFGRHLAATDLGLGSLADLDRRRHIETYLSAVAEATSSLQRQAGISIRTPGPRARGQRAAERHHRVGLTRGATAAPGVLLRHPQASPPAAALPGRCPTHGPANRSSSCSSTTAGACRRRRCGPSSPAPRRPPGGSAALKVTTTPRAEPICVFAALGPRGSRP